MGSVKDLMVIENPEKEKLGMGRFFFSDRYSVFDWGEMPDHIPFKGEALCLVSSYFFEKLENYGLKTHYLGVFENHRIKRLEELNFPSPYMGIKLVRVIRPHIIENNYDYSPYKNEHGNFLIPFEIIYRNALPDGSSVFKRLKEGQLSIQKLGIDKIPLPGEIFKKPIIDISTKLESSDRYITWMEAKEIGNLSEEELNEIKKITGIVNKVITEEVEKSGIKNLDGKIEVAFDENRNIILVDAIGTPDECRFEFNNFSISKEILRVFYSKTSWFKEVEMAKKEEGFNWRGKVKSSPPPLPSELKNLVSMMYRAYVNEITGKEWFKSILPLKKIVRMLKEFEGKYGKI